MADVRVKVDPAAVQALLRDRDPIAWITAVGEDMARRLAAVTPKDTGAGAASIAARRDPTSGASDVGWDAEHGYLRFPEFGTVHQREQRFARGLLDRYTIR